MGVSYPACRNSRIHWPDCAGELRAGEVRAFEICAGEVRAFEVRAVEVRAGKIRADEVHAAKVRADEVCAGKIREVEVEDICRAVMGGVASGYHRQGGLGIGW